MRLLSTTLALTLTISALAQTPAKRPMTFADLQAMKRVGDPQVSPSGKWVLFSVTDVSLEKNTKTNSLYAVPVDGSANEHVVSPGSSEGRFAPDGKSVLFMSAAGTPTVQPWDDDHGELTGKGHGFNTGYPDADGFLWAPDSQHVLFSAPVYAECESKQPMGRARNQAEVDCSAAKDAEEAKNPVKARIFTELLYRHWNQFMGPKHSHIFYGSIDPKDGPPTDLTPASVIGGHEAPTFSLGGGGGYAISPDGKEIAYQVNLDKVPAESTNNDIFTLQVGAEPSTAKKVSTSPGSDANPQYSSDGKWLAWTSQARDGYESDKNDLVVMDRATGKIRDLTKKFDGSVDEYVWLPQSVSIVFTSALHGEEDVYDVYMPMPGLPAKDIGNPELLNYGAEFGDLHPFEAGLVATRMKVNEPTELYVLPAHGKNNQWPLLNMNDRLLAELSLSPQESFWFSGANGTKVEGFLIRPPNFDPAKKYPVKFLIHGGPQGAWGDAWSYRWNPELFAADGYVVVMVNPRGSTGYGMKFEREVSGDWGGRPYIDLMKGLDYAEQHYSFIDKDRECALGASYGGFMADWVLTHTNRFKCIVTHDGMYNPQSAFGTTEELWFNEWEFRPLVVKPGAPGPDSRTRESSGTAPEGADVEQTAPAHPWDFYDKPASEDPFRKWSPMLHIKDAHTPTLVIHNQKDYRLDVSEGFQLFTALQLLHVPSKMLYFPDEGHWVLKPKNSELWYETVNDWCDRWLGMGKYAAAGPEPNPAPSPVRIKALK